jgi:glycosyltransferase involved in cell wall biosynthesis
LVDDGSTDGSSGVCDEHLHDERIKVLHTAHKGVADARNAGLAIFSGDYVGFLDGDDYLALNFYEYLYEISQGYNADLVSSDYKKVYNDEREERVSHQLCPEQVQQVTGRFMLEHLRSPRYYPSNTILGSKLYRRQLWEKLNFPSGRLHEDEYVIHEIYHRTKIVCLTSMQLYNYVQRSGSIMRIEKNERFDDVTGVFAHRIQYFERSGDGYLRNQAELHELLVLADFYVNLNNQTARQLLIEKAQAYTNNPLISTKYILLLKVINFSRPLGLTLMKASALINQLWRKHL